jgi:predicted phage gp36 major capsid-like protein
MKKIGFMVKDVFSHASFDALLSLLSLPSLRSRMHAAAHVLQFVPRGKANINALRNFTGKDTDEEEEEKDPKGSKKNHKKRPQHSTAQHSTIQHSTAQHSTAQHSTSAATATATATSQHDTARHSTAQRSTAPHRTAQPSRCHYHRCLCHLFSLPPLMQSFWVSKASGRRGGR